MLSQARSSWVVWCMIQPVNPMIMDPLPHSFTGKWGSWPGTMCRVIKLCKFSDGGAGEAYRQEKANSHLNYAPSPVRTSCWLFPNASYQLDLTSHLVVVWSTQGMLPCWALSIGLCYWKAGHLVAAVAKLALIGGGVPFSGASTREP